MDSLYVAGKGDYRRVAPNRALRGFTLNPRWHLALAARDPIPCGVRPHHVGFDSRARPTGTGQSRGQASTTS